MTRMLSFCQFVTITYPGQLPAVRRDVSNVVVPVDLSDPEDMLLVAKTISTFIQRTIPVRFGLVPTTSSPESIAQLKIAHYLQDTYGLGSLVAYLEDVKCPLSPVDIDLVTNSRYTLVGLDGKIRRP